MRLHGYWRSNATYRVRVALLLKGIAFEEIEYDLLKGHQFDAAFLALNPNAAVPALEVEGRVITQSYAILDYLDTLPGGPALLPSDPFDRAEAIALAMGTIADAHPLIVPRIRKRLAEHHGADEAAVKGWARHWLTEGAAAYEARLSRRKPDPYLFGDTVGLADIALASHVVAGGPFDVDLSPFPILSGYVERLLALPAFAEAHPFRRKEIVEAG
ncbi:maleylacetoacetate isomerase [Flavimaricola marinus]|uniref:Maleylpyruvate isomerase n=1 Tax=Flavimaricola marinus TaxID=1819565 RepID=A0A238LK65_9RHOB|nr:maleylacetoacetate isomerase [Flavimaricola marinus]SMY09923.1 Maleylpyruvate isomerase [Flavimaricola marinus]